MRLKKIIEACEEGDGLRLTAFGLALFILVDLAAVALAAFTLHRG